MNLFETLKKYTAKQPECVALSGEGVQISYGELLQQIDKKIKHLIGVKCKRVALTMDNGVEWILWDLACVRADIPCVPLPPFFTPEQKRHAITSAGITHIISEAGISGYLGKNEILLPEGTSKITFTSGTTGTPKGVCLSQDGLEQVARSLVDVIGTEDANRHISIMPLAVLLENVAGVYAALLAGVSIDLPPLAKTQNIFAALSSGKASSAILVPELLQQLMVQMAQNKQALPDLKFLAVGGAKLSPDLILKARAMGLPVYEGYGLSECGSVVSLNTPEHDTLGSVGKILPHIDIEVAKRGEIVVNNPVFLGYLGEERKGPFPTGDLGKIDQDGFLSVTGREKNILITSYGRNVSPEWVESLLLGCGEILQVIVYGDAQPVLSALIVPTRAGIQAPEMQAAIDKINEGLPDYAHIKNWHYVPPFTLENGFLTGTGRPKRELVLETYSSLTKLKESSDEFLRQVG